MKNLRVVTYNIQHGCNLAGTLDLGQCARELSDLGPDIVALQEVDSGKWNTRLTDQARDLAKRLGMYYAYGPVRRYMPGSYGNAILSRYPIQNCRNHIMTPTSDRRCCLEAEIAAEGKDLLVLVLHLGLKVADRLQQLQETIIPLVQGVTRPCIAAGDFNSLPASREISMMLEYMADSFAVSTGAEHNTFPSDHPHIRIDYIFTANCQAQDCRIISAARASDHLPVTADIFLP